MSEPARPLAQPGTSDTMDNHKLRIVDPARKAVPAGIWERFVATTVDAIAVTIISAPVKYGLMFVGRLYFDPKSPAGAGITMLAGMLVTFVTVYFYYGYFYSTRGASPGKALMRLKVLKHGTGTYPSYGQAFGRETIGKGISSLILGIGYLMVAFRSDKRALHDLMAKTEVVKIS